MSTTSALFRPALWSSPPASPTAGSGSPHSTISSAPASFTAPPPRRDAAWPREHVYVVGGGNSAGQTAMHLSRYARQVTLVARRNDLSETHVQLSARGDRSDHEHRRPPGDRGGRRRRHDPPRRSLSLRESATGNTEEVQAAGLFILIGAHPHTDWLPPEIQRDEGGYLLTGQDLTETGRGDGRWPLNESLSDSRPACRVSSLPVTCAPTRSSELPRPSAKARCSSPSFTNCSRRPRLLGGAILRLGSVWLVLHGKRPSPGLAHHRPRWMPIRSGSPAIARVSGPAGGPPPRTARGAAPRRGRSSRRRSEAARVALAPRGGSTIGSRVPSSRRSSASEARARPAIREGATPFRCSRRRSERGHPRCCRPSAGGSGRRRSGRPRRARSRRPRSAGKKRTSWRSTSATTPRSSSARPFRRAPGASRPPPQPKTIRPSGVVRK